jgi:hypothetical protein
VMCLMFFHDWVCVGSEQGTCGKVWLTWECAKCGAVKVTEEGW